MITNPIVNVYTAASRYVYANYQSVYKLQGGNFVLTGNPPDGSPASKLRINITTNVGNPPILIQGFDADKLPLSETFATSGAGFQPDTTNAYASLSSMTISQLLSGLGGVTVDTKDSVVYGSGDPLIFLDSIGMSGMTIQAVWNAGTGTAGTISYSIDASLQPLYAMPTFSGPVTGGIIDLPSPVANAVPFVTGASAKTASFPPTFFSGSFATLMVTITSLVDSSNSDASLTVIVQQMPAVTR